MTRLALFDLDNTLLAGDSDYEWAQFLMEEGVLEREAYEARNLRFYEAYKAGTLDIHEFLDFQLRPLAEHPRPVLDAWHARFMERKVRPMISTAARELVASHAGDIRVIVTATNSFVTGPIAAELGVEHLIATVPAEDNACFTGKVAGLPCFRDGKVARLCAWLDGRGESLASYGESWFYSDSANDLPLLEHVSHPVAVDPDERLERHARERGWPILRLHGAGAGPDR